MDVMKAPPDQVARLLWQQCGPGLVLFLGAGVSAASGLPLQDQMKDELLSLLLDRRIATLGSLGERLPTWQSAARNVMLEAMLETVVDSQPDFLSHIAPLFCSGRFGTSHLAAARLLADRRVSAIITTNFDRLLEDAYEDVRSNAPDAGIPPLSRLVAGGSESDIRASRLIKLHGTAESPESIALTLRQVGFGLPASIAQAFSHLASHPFVFAGYSDADKDITPFLATLPNRWAWLFHHDRPPEAHAPPGSPLQQFLSSHSRIAYWTDSSAVLVALSEATWPGVSPVHTPAPDSGPSWRDTIRGATSAMSPWVRTYVLGNILWRRLWAPEDAAVCFAAVASDATDGELQFLGMLQCMSVYGDKWEHGRVRLFADQAKRQLDLLGNPPSLSTKFHRLRGNLLQQEGVRVEDALRAYLQAEDEAARARDPIAAAQSMLNRATTLHKIARNQEAEPLFQAAIEVFRATRVWDWFVEGNSNYASLLIATGRLDDAEALLTDAESQFCGTGASASVARLWYNRGVLADRRVDYAGSLRYLTSALKVFQLLKSSRWAERVTAALEEVRAKLDAAG